MPFQSAPNIAEAVIRATIGGIQIANVLNFRRPGGYDQTDIDDLAALVDDSWSTNVLPLLCSLYGYNETQVRGLELLNDLTAINSDGAGSGGVSVGGCAINNVSYVVTFRTNFTGRSARGRLYLAGIPNAATATTTTVENTFRVNVDAAFEQMRLDFAASNWVWVVLSRFTLGAPRAFGIGTDIVSAQTRNALLDSQRGRLAPGH